MRRRLSRSVIGCGAVLLVAGCGGQSGPVPGGAAPAAGGSGGSVKLQGAGASFPAPLYNKWFKSYSAAHQNVLVDYQSVGSGGGVKSVIDRTVDFGASDAAMKPADMAKVPDGVQLFPMTAGSIVLSYNLPGVESLKLSRKAYGGIFNGTVKRWNDPAIVEANPGVKLSDLPINVVVRADSSGTSFVFSQHLAAMSPEFSKNVGANTMPNWSVGTKSKGNEGVTAGIMTTPGSIGYVEYGYAKSQKMATAVLENKSGKFVEATTASGQAALATATLPDDMIAWAPDPDAADAYPIVTYTWLIEELMLELRQRFTIAIVTHNLQQAQRVADYTGFLYVDTNGGARTGYLVEFGDSQQVFHDPIHEHTKQYIRGEFS